MATNGLKPDEELSDAANVNSWKTKLTAILDENALDDLVFNATEELQQMLVDLPTRKSKVRLEDSFMIPS